MKQSELNKKMLEMIPDLIDGFNKICDELDGLDTGSTIVIEDVFMPFFIKSFETNDANGLNKAISFIEWLSNYYDDEYAGDVLVICVYEYIHYHKYEKQLVDVLGSQAAKQYSLIKWQSL